MKTILILLSLSVPPSLYDGAKPRPKRSEVGRFIIREYRKFKRTERREIRRIEKQSVPLEGAYIPKGYYTLQLQNEKRDFGFISHGG